MEHNGRTLRHEYKYIIGKTAAAVLRARLKAAMKPDINSNGDGYRVTSLYLEDIYRTAYNDKIAGINQRVKFRVRAYNLEPSTLRLEAKRKDDLYVSKKNAPLTPEQHALILKGDYSFGRGEEFRSTAMEELLISENLTRPRPSVLVDYFREAFVEPSGNIRVTIDSNLSTCYNSLNMFNGCFSPIFGDKFILEIKYGGFIPSYVAELFSGLAIHREAVSKFILCTDKLLEVKKQCGL